MTNEPQKPAVPASNPAPTPAPQQNQGDGKPNNDKSGSPQQK
jgi:hypothetical protein